MGIFAEVFRRTAALVILRISGTFAGGSIAGVELWQSAAVAAFIGVMDVAENLSRAYMIDGKLDIYEVNAAFGGAADPDIDEALGEDQADFETEDVSKAQSKTKASPCFSINRGYTLYMAKNNKGERNSDRPKGKAWKKRPKVFDGQKRRLVTKNQL